MPEVVLDRVAFSDEELSQSCNLQLESFDIMLFSFSVGSRWRV